MKASVFVQSLRLFCEVRPIIPFYALQSVCLLGVTMFSSSNSDQNSVTDRDEVAIALTLLSVTISIFPPLTPSLELTR